MPESVSVKIWIKTHSDCIKNKNIQNTRILSRSSSRIESSFCYTFKWSILKYKCFCIERALSRCEQCGQIWHFCHTFTPPKKSSRKKIWNGWKTEVLLFETTGQSSDVMISKMAARGKFKSRNLFRLLRSTKWNANLILACDLADLVALYKVIIWKTHIPVRTPIWPPWLIFAGACHGQ